MSRARRGAEAAPFARARAEGFLFESEAMSRAFKSLCDAASGGRFPIVIGGRSGVGKATLLKHWAEEARSQGWITPRLDVTKIDVGDLTASILAALGQRPVDGASAEQALLDFLEDCLLEDLGVVLLVPNIEHASASLIHQLAQLARPPSEGGVHLLLAATSAEPSIVADFLKAERVALEPLSVSDTEIFIAAALDAAGVHDLEVEDGFTVQLHSKSSGLIGEAGPLLDQAVARLRSAGTGTLTPALLEGHVEAPSPRDIEDALLALTGERMPALRRDTHRQDHPMSRAFPKIELGAPNLPEDGPANDPKASLDPEILDALEVVAKELTALDRQLTILRAGTESLETASRERTQSASLAGDAFLKSLRNRPVQAEEE